MIRVSSEALHFVDQILDRNETKGRDNFLPKDQPILIYGAGNRGHQVRKVLADEGYRVLGFMDQSFSGCGIHSALPAYPIGSVVDLGFQDNPPYVVVAIFRHDIDITEVFRTLPNLGFAGVISFHELVERFPDAFENVLWQGKRYLHFLSRTEIALALTLLDDEKSQEIFLECLELRMGNPLAMQTPDRVHQYFPPDILPHDCRHRFIDCGAYDGDTWASATDYGIEFESFVAIEPDSSNFTKLVSRMRKDKRRPSEVLLIPCAVWSNTMTLRFGAGSSQNSHVDPAGSSLVQAIALDDLLLDFRTSWLKFDIEGAEIEALEGAKNIIARDRPFLSIAAYHCADHLWKILLLINSWKLGYKFYLRPHGYAGVDLVLYARSARARQ